MSDEWIVIPNWEKFQHYSDRNPAWIKLYTDLAHRDQWVRLTFAQRGLLVSLWVEYALSRTQLRTSAVPGALQQKVLKRSLDSLVEAGFIQLSASAPPKPSASLEKEKKREDKDLPKKVSTTKPVDNSAVVEQRIASMIRNGTIHDQVDLEAEIRGEHLNSELADRLRGMLKPL